MMRENDDGILSADSWDMRHDRSVRTSFPPAIVSIVVRCLDADGSPMSGVPVYFSRSVADTTWHAAVSTDADGYARWPWCLILDPSAQGYGAYPFDYLGPWDRISGPAPPVVPAGEVLIVYRRRTGS
ncbi:MAG: hypothetical protein N3A38_14505 [Planctomycetota bacterium]|nr:hypothetical protein [Planctomycetota bacterium]